MEERMYILIAKSLNQEATIAEQQELDAWLETDVANKNMYEEMRAVWADTDMLFQQPEFDAGAAWEKVASQTVQVQETPRTKVIPMKRWYRVSLTAAAVLLIVLAINFLTGSSTESVTAGSQMLAVTLPDNSTVKLQPGSTLKYPTSFSGETRSVELSGEAFFDVARNEQQPFIIDADRIMVEVLGTSFYVTTGADLASVAVSTGRVSVTSKENAAEVILTPGQKGVLRDEELNIVPDTNYSFYKNGVLTFTGVSLEQAVPIIANVKNSKVSIDRSMPAVLRQQIIEISFNNQPLEEILNELCLITNTRWRKDKGNYLIYAK